MIRPGVQDRFNTQKRKVMRKGELVEIEDRNQTNNARSESIATKPTFRQAYTEGHRCIIPAIEFDEPCWETGKNQWWNFRRADGQPWGVAGYWSEWTDPQTGEVVPNYTMVTVNCDSHPLASRMHKPELDAAGNFKSEQDKRSIVPLDPAHWECWLFGSNADADLLLELPPVEAYDAGPEPERPKPSKPPMSVRKQAGDSQERLF